jgi:hypothetical protein
MSSKATVDNVKLFMVIQPSKVVPTEGFYIVVEDDMDFGVGTCWPAGTIVYCDYGGTITAFGHGWIPNEKRESYTTLKLVRIPADKEITVTN